MRERGEFMPGTADVYLYEPFPGLLSLPPVDGLTLSDFLLTGCDA